MSQPAASAKTQKTKNKTKQGKGTRNLPYDPQNPNLGPSSVPLPRSKRPRVDPATESQKSVTDSDVTMEQKDGGQQPAVDPNNWANWPFPQVQTWAKEAAILAAPPRDPKGSFTGTLTTGSSRGEILVTLHDLRAGCQESEVVRGKSPQDFVICKLNEDKWNLITQAIESNKIAPVSEAVPAKLTPAPAYLEYADLSVLMWVPAFKDKPKELYPVDFAVMLPRKGWEQPLRILRFYRPEYNEETDNVEWIRTHALRIIYKTQKGVQKALSTNRMTLLDGHTKVYFKNYVSPYKLFPDSDYPVSKSNGHSTMAPKNSSNNGKGQQVEPRSKS
jgi:hypothetical protein